jgi:hypothetical protein
VTVHAVDYAVQPVAVLLENAVQADPVLLPSYLPGVRLTDGDYAV